MSVCEVSAGPEYRPGDVVAVRTDSGNHYAGRTGVVDHTYWSEHMYAWEPEGLFQIVVVMLDGDERVGIPDPQVEWVYPNG